MVKQLLTIVEMFFLFFKRYCQLESVESDLLGHQDPNGLNHTVGSGIGRRKNDWLFCSIFSDSSDFVSVCLPSGILGVNSFGVEANKKVVAILGER
jgi:hypothetical protein